MSIIFIHGTKQFGTAQQLKQQWDLAGFGEGLGTSSSVAFWADLAHEIPHTEPTFLDCATFGPLRMAGIRSGHPYMSDAGDNEKAYLNDVVRYSIELENSRRREARHLGISASGILPPDWSERVTQWFIEMFQQDANTYFKVPVARAAIQERVRVELLQATPPIMVIAHSLGSAIGYDVLHSLTRTNGFEVEVLVTIGSQMGVPTIQSRLAKPLEVPKNVNRWFNYLDRWDLMSLGKLLKPHFRPQKIEDTWVNNLSEGNHAAVGYLSTPIVRSVLAKFHSEI